MNGAGAHARSLPQAPRFHDLLAHRSVDKTGGKEEMVEPARARCRPRSSLCFLKSQAGVGAAPCIRMQTDKEVCFNKWSGSAPARPKASGSDAAIVSRSKQQQMDVSINHKVSGANR